MTTVGDVVAQLERWYDPAWAEPWDSVGLVSGDPDRQVEAVHVAVDPVEAVAAEAAERGAGLLVTHHPLFLGGTSSMARTGPKGRALALVDALFVAHTNADVADPGVSDALAATLGVTGLVPLQSQDVLLDRWVVHVPRTHTPALLDAMAAAGAGRFGDYERCAFTAVGEGTFTPLAGAQPYVGTVGTAETVEENRLEMVADPRHRAAIGRAVRAAHPYEAPSVTVVPASAPSTRGLGRVGTLSQTLALQDFCGVIADRLPRTSWGLRASGDPTTPIRSVAVAGGACLDLVELAATAGADVLVTSDAKHHRAQEAPIPVIDVAHWAGEWPWTEALGQRLRHALPGVTVTVSELVTDPWTTHRAGSSP
ncbi:MAG TPA: Nif3-like dinuclear metal center hexameric protein [Mycobacteriales bacterium]